MFLIHSIVVRSSRMQPTKDFAMIHFLRTVSTVVYANIEDDKNDSNQGIFNFIADTFQQFKV